MALYLSYCWLFSHIVSSVPQVTSAHVVIGQAKVVGSIVHQGYGLDSAGRSLDAPVSQVAACANEEMGNMGLVDIGSGRGCRARCRIAQQLLHGWGQARAGEVPLS
jgi:hypothetical protein